MDYVLYHLEYTTFAMYTSLGTLIQKLCYNYHIDTSVLLENIPLVKFLQNHILDPSGVFSIPTCIYLFTYLLIYLFIYIFIYIFIYLFNFIYTWVKHQDLK